ncbi:MULTISPECIES: TolC family protein [unclassified Acidovorax]|uniref:TolC family protein n=1 Tax=unclassified Acidovorax TaxID=2684926 RepID=UPI000C18A5C7|nr:MULTISPECIES: TolC family protein [unclassified Acidovorax]PIF17924.1 cobalt-zinc-cadmium efflux system outer membrane protein [Acidovorax sp. 59]PKW03052.1 cobalt-zinc-cadmium efflux system outer membrane protein [Acidovorax sp. 30]
MFKGTYLQEMPHAWRGGRKIKLAAGAAAIWLSASGGAFSQGLPPGPAVGERAPQSAAAAAAEPLSLAKAIELALEGNPEVAAAKRQWEATEGQVLQGRSRPNPELAYSLEDTRSKTRTQSWQLNLPLELGGKRAARTKAAEKTREQAQAQLAELQATVRANVAAAYFDVLTAQERLVLARDSAALAKSSTDTVSKRVAAGKVSPVEESKARVAEAGVRVELAQAASEQRNALSRLFALLGRIDAPYTVLEGKAENLPSVPSLVDLQPLIASSPGVVLARIEVDRRKALTDLEQSKRVPDVTVSVGMQRSNETQRNVLLFGVSVPLPVFDRNQGNLLEALKLEDKARDELQAATVRLHSEVAQARERLSTITAEVQSLQQEVLPGAKSAYDAATIGFENGKFNFLEVLDAQRTYFTAKSQYLKALGEAHRAAADIDRLLGASMVTGLIATQH